MSRSLTLPFVMLFVLGSGYIGNQEASACARCIYRTTHEKWVYTNNHSTTVEQSAAEEQPAESRVTYNVVQATPQYDVRRPEVPSGTRITLFANFLRKEQGVVMLNLNGTSTECHIADWKPESVTVELPRLGLARPKLAEIVVILPDGRIAKTFRILLVAQPDIMVHQDTVPLPMPAAPSAEPATYATPVDGGHMQTER
jgi:hypothetical protein